MGSQNEFGTAAQQAAYRKGYVMSQEAHRRVALARKLSAKEEAMCKLMGREFGARFRAELNPPADVIEQYASADRTGREAAAFYCGWLDGAYSSE